MPEQQTFQESQSVARVINVAAEAPLTPNALAEDQRVASPQETRALAEFRGGSGALAEFPKSQALYEVSEVGLRGTAMVLLRTMVLEMESELRGAKERLTALDEEYRAECLKTAVLQIQLRSERRQKILQNVLITVGGIINTVAVKLLFEKQQSSGLVFLVLGIVLILSGWLWPRGGEEKE